MTVEGLIANTTRCVAEGIRKGRGGGPEFGVPTMKKRKTNGKRLLEEIVILQARRWEKNRRKGRDRRSA